MQRTIRIAAIAIALLAAMGLASMPALAAGSQYSRMMPIAEYLMSRQSEIALARSAAPASISRQSTVLVLGRHGYETAVSGTNGWVCLVGRGWYTAFDWPEFWNPKIRGAECLNPPAAKSIVPMAEMRTKLLFAGYTKDEVIRAMAISLREGKLPELGPGAMSYMMAKGSYLTDAGPPPHNGPHLMFYTPLEVGGAAEWGAGAAGSPVNSGPYWFISSKLRSRYKGLPPLTIYTADVPTWSDGTPAPR